MHSEPIHPSLLTPHPIPPFTHSDTPFHSISNIRVAGMKDLPDFGAFRDILVYCNTVALSAYVQIL